MRLVGGLLGLRSRHRLPILENEYHPALNRVGESGNRFTAARRLRRSRPGFAEASKRLPIWKDALKEWNVIDSQEVLEWINMGRDGFRLGRPQM